MLTEKSPENSPVSCHHGNNQWSTFIQKRDQQIRYRERSGHNDVKISSDVSVKSEMWMWQQIKAPDLWHHQSHDDWTEVRRSTRSKNEISVRTFRWRHYQLEEAQSWDVHQLGRLPTSWDSRSTRSEQRRLLSDQSPEALGGSKPICGFGLIVLEYFPFCNNFRTVIWVKLAAKCWLSHDLLPLAEGNILAPVRRCSGFSTISGNMNDCTANVNSFTHRTQAAKHVSSSQRIHSPSSMNDLHTKLSMVWWEQTQLGWPGTHQTDQFSCCSSPAASRLPFLTGCLVQTGCFSAFWLFDWSDEDQ